MVVFIALNMKWKRSYNFGFFTQFTKIILFLLQNYFTTIEICYVRLELIKFYIVMKCFKSCCTTDKCHSPVRLTKNDALILNPVTMSFKIKIFR